MAQIKCPHCGKAFTVDESEYASIVKQVRDAEFERDIEERVRLVEKNQGSAVAAAEARAREAAQAELADVRSKAVSDLMNARAKAASDLADARSAAQTESARKDALIAGLKAQLEGAKSSVESARATAESAAAQKLARAEAALARAEAASAAALAAAKSSAAADIAERDRRIAELEAAAKSREEAFDAQRALAVTQAVSEQDQQIVALKGELTAAKLERDQVEASLKQAMAEQLGYKDQAIREKDDEIERMRSQRSRLSVKLIGESLEQHCETEFNRLRMTAFPNAYFEKDNDASEGTKGDFIFRECDASGNEVISIMFEMKNENDETATKHKNEDFFKKLDHDRRQKGCEYAVLCTLLEPESELYNAGIVDVSYRYEKMYVIRPQFFIPMITLLRNAAMGSLRYKQELAEYKQQNIDVTNFEAKMEKFKDGFSRNYNLASKQFESAIKEIDAAIKQLEKTKDDLRRSTENLRLAHNKADELTIRKLTWGNKTMKAAFDEARETASETGDEPAEADSYEVEEAE